MTNDSYRPQVKVKRSSAGLGLFADEIIPKNQLIIEYTGDRISDEEANERGGRYLFQVTDDLVIDGKDRKHTARYLNHSCNPNAEAEHEITEDRIYIRAIKNMTVGDEITIDYGKEYIEDFIAGQCKCSTCLLKRG